MKRKLLLFVFSMALIPNILFSNKSYAVMSFPFGIIGMGIGAGMVGLGMGYISNRIPKAGRIALIIGGIIVAEKKVKGNPQDLARELTEKCKFSERTMRNYDSDPMLHSVLSEFRSLNDDEVLDFLKDKSINKDTRKVLKCYYSFYNSKSA